MKKLYEMIWIKSEGDLPKGNEAYISHSTSGHLGYRRCIPNKKEDHATFENISGEWWLKNIDWYLNPIYLTEQSITQKCHQCGNTSYKELHCRECGNNFPFDVEDIVDNKADDIDNNFVNNCKYYLPQDGECSNVNIPCNECVGIECGYFII